MRAEILVKVSMPHGELELTFLSQAGARMK